MYVYIICECVRYLTYTHILPYRNKKLFVQKNVTVKKKKSLFCNSYNQALWSCQQES